MTQTYEATDKLAVQHGCHYDEEAARRAISFVESEVYHDLGRWVGQPLVLLPWQREFIGRLFGWKQADGSRRYLTAHLSAAKNNGTTTTLLALAAALTRDDHGPRSEVRLQAARGGVADHLIGRAKAMFKASPRLKRDFRYNARLKYFADGVSGGSLLVRSTRVKTFEGMSNSAALLDDLHTLRDIEVWDSTRPYHCVRPGGLGVTAGGAGLDRRQWLAEREFGRSVNAGVLTSYRHLAMIFEADPGDDPSSPDTWRKANPSLGVIKSEAFLRDAYAEASRTLGLMTEFKRLHLNMVV